MIIEYVKATFTLDNGTLDDNGSLPSSPALGSGRIKLGEHESVLIFTIENMPAAAGDLIMHLPFMSNNPGQHNVLWLIKDQRSQQYILSENNQFTVERNNFIAGNTSLQPPGRKRHIETDAHSSRLH